MWGTFFLQVATLVHTDCLYVCTSAVGGCESLCLEASGVDCRGKLVRGLSITTDPLSGEGPGATCVHREEMSAHCCKVPIIHLCQTCIV